MPVLQTALLDRVHGLLAPQESDAELLGSFTARRDEAAFAELVRRHGPMVLRLCRRLLGEAHAAEDCFQATFLALARRAGSIRRPAAVAAWLYGVAYRVSLKARAQRARRRALAAADASTCPDPRPGPLDRLSGREVIDAFEEEMQRLPESYRLPITLCCLEGLSLEEAARRLGWTPGAVKGRLERGRTRLHARLVRRGLTLSAALAAAEAARGLATAGVPAALLSATIPAALAFAGSPPALPAVVPTAAARLAGEVLRGTGRIRRLLPLALVVGVGLAALGAVSKDEGGRMKDESREEQPGSSDSSFILHPSSFGGPAARTDRFGDPLPPGTLFRVGTTRLQYEGALGATAGSPDGKRLAAVNSGGTLCLWDTATGKEVHRLQGAAGGWLAFTPDSKSLAFNRGGKLCLLDLATREVRKTLGSAARHGAFAADGKTLTLVQDNGGLWVRRLDLATGKPLKEWQFRPEPPRDVGVRPPPRRPRIGLVVPEPPTFWFTTWLSADGAALVTLEIDSSDRAKVKQTLRLHDVAGGKELRRWQIPAPVVMDFALSPDGKFLATSGADPTLRLWDAATGKEVRRWQDPREHTQNVGLKVTFTPDGQSLLAGGPAGVNRWDWRTGKKLRTYPGTWGPITFLKGGKAMAVLGFMNSLWLLDVETGKDLCPLGRPNARIAFSPDGLVAWPEGRALVLADAATGKLVRRWTAHQGEVGVLTFAPDGATLASIGTDRHIRLWDTRTGKEIRSMPHEGWYISRLQFSADGRRLASVSGWYSDVCVWDVATGKRRGRWQGDRLTTHDPGVRVVAVADRGANVLRLADADSGKALHALRGYQERVGYFYSMGFGGHGSHGDFPPLFSPDGRLLLSGGVLLGGGKDGAVHFWDVASGKRLAPVLDGKQFIFKNMAFSPDSRLLALTRSDCLMCLMDAATGEVVRTLGKADGPMTAPPAFTPDGRTLVTVVKGLVQVWEVATGGEICRRQGHRGDIFDLTVAPDGRACATVAYDYLILIWDLARLVPGARPRAALSAAELDAAWGELASPDAAKGRHAIELLTAAPAQALALVRKRLPPAPVPDDQQVARWLDDLGSDSFKQRERATKALGRLGEAVAPALRKALAAGPPLEARRRLEDLLKKLNPTTLPPGTLRAVRAVQVLEALASPEAQGVLQELARGAPRVRVTDDAAAALRRLEARARSKRPPAR